MPDGCLRRSTESVVVMDTPVPAVESNPDTAAENDGMGGILAEDEDPARLICGI